MPSFTHTHTTYNIYIYNGARWVHTIIDVDHEKTGLADSSITDCIVQHRQIDTNK